ncbi:hypothetical protein NO1_1455 [Candidatus Termititenax aidoneus]|uniref:Uncharacterized protein n=1 Tax=Termititenax aidoneus TaxID=2218524 RepID=A0A388TE73_TERA1|nr:hypothetical protein NO1_1455 [Candidatus Termititenax aidoneus]
MQRKQIAAILQKINTGEISSLADLPPDALRSKEVVVACLEANIPFKDLQNIPVEFWHDVTVRSLYNQKNPPPYDPLDKTSTICREILL